MLSLLYFLAFLRCLFYSVTFRNTNETCYFICKDTCNFSGRLVKTKDLRGGDTDKNFVIEMIKIFWKNMFIVKQIFFFIQKFHTIIETFYFCMIKKNWICMSCLHIKKYANEMYIQFYFELCNNVFGYFIYCIYEYFKLYILYWL